MWRNRPLPMPWRPKKCIFLFQQRQTRRKQLYFPKLAGNGAPRGTSRAEGGLHILWPLLLSLFFCVQLTTDIAITGKTDPDWHAFPPSSSVDWLSCVTIPYCFCCVGCWDLRPMTKPLYWILSGEYVLKYSHYDQWTTWNSDPTVPWYCKILYLGAMT